VNAVYCEFETDYKGDSYFNVQSHPVVPEGQDQELTIRDSETSGRMKYLIKIVFEKTEKRVIIV